MQVDSKKGAESQSLFCGQLSATPCVQLDANFALEIRAKKRMKQAYSVQVELQYVRASLSLKTDLWVFKGRCK